MEVTALEKELKENKLRSLYLLYGEERFLLENCLNKIQKIFGDKINGINFISLDSSNVSNIISDIQTPAFGYPKKMIIIKESGLLKKKTKSKKGSDSSKKDTKKDENKDTIKIAEYIKENIDEINESVIIVFVESDIDKNELYKVIEKDGVVCEFAKLKPNDIVRKLKAICNAYKVNVDESTLRYFIEVCGTNMQELINEIRKQIEYAGENGTITKQSIDKLATKQLESVIFDLTDNLGKKNIQVALSVLSNLLYQKEPIQKILITLYNHFKKLYITKIALKENRNIAESLQLKPNQMFLTSKYTMQAKYFKEAELRNILQELINLDYNSKNGNIDATLGLQTILCECCS